MLTEWTNQNERTIGLPAWVSGWRSRAAAGTFPSTWPARRYSVGSGEPPRSSWRGSSQRSGPASADSDQGKRKENKWIISSARSARLRVNRIHLFLTSGYWGKGHVAAFLKWFTIGRHCEGRGSSWNASTTRRCSITRINGQNFTSTQQRSSWHDVTKKNSRSFQIESAIKRQRSSRFPSFFFSHSSLFRANFLVKYPLPSH